MDSHQIRSTDHRLDLRKSPSLCSPPTPAVRSISQSQQKHPAVIHQNAYSSNVDCVCKSQPPEGGKSLWLSACAVS